MKKIKILFILQHLIAGGVEKSLETLLACFDKNQYDIDILLLEPSGINIKLAQNTRVIPFPNKQDSRLCSMYSRICKIANSFRKGDIYSAFKYSISYLLHHGVVSLDFKLRRFDIRGMYDFAVAYHVHQELSVYFAAKICKARHRYAWIHNDFESCGFRFTDTDLLKRIDSFFCVSKSVQKEFASFYPQFASKSALFYNIINLESVQTLSEEVIESPWNNNNELKLLTIARLDYQKGIDIAIQACSLLVERGVSLHWCIIGDGDDYPQYQRMINTLNLNSCITLLGYRKNPYPYIKLCDIYVQPSRHEGYGIAVAESRLLCKPIICTDFSGANEQIRNGITGSIVECTSEKIAGAIYDIYVSPQTKNMYIQNLKAESQVHNNDLVKKYFM